MHDNCEGRAQRKSWSKTPELDLGATTGSTQNGLLPRFPLLGAATLISVGYVDPGNWATDIEGGARFGYQLVWVLIISGLIATILQTLSVRLGLVTGLDLATACRTYLPRPLVLPLWALAELAIVACDMAEVLGSAVALNLLFGLPLLPGALITVCDVFLILAVQRRGARGIEVLVGALVLTIGLCLGLQVLLSRPEWGSFAGGLRPHLDTASLFVAVGMLGATVMPHNLYLHSALVQRRSQDSAGAQKRRLRRGLGSTAFALGMALALNIAILVVAAAAFHTRGLDVPDLQAAHRLLTPVLGTSVAAVLFAVALLCSGQSSSITGTLAGQVVMEGFLQLRLPPALRRLLTRGLAIVPAVIVLALVGERGTMPLLVASQVVLSLQLPFVVVPLLRFTASGEVMGRHANPSAVRVISTLCALAVVTANIALVVGVLEEWRRQWPVLAALGVLVGGAALALLGWTSVVPLRTLQREREHRESPTSEPISEAL
jgi:manganese transport protein